MEPEVWRRVSDLFSECLTLPEAERTSFLAKIATTDSAIAQEIRKLLETYGEPGSFDAVVFLQTIEHVEDPIEVLRRCRLLLRPGGVAYISTPNVLTLAPKGAARSDNPWHVREYRAEEFRALVGEVFDDVELLGLFHARKLRVHELALRLGWDAVHRRLGLTRPFYDRFTPAIASRDFALRGSDLDRALDFLAVGS